MRDSGGLTTMDANGLSSRYGSSAVKLNHSIESARDCLRNHFGSAWDAPYAPGKADMARWLADQLTLDHEAAVRLIEEMERNGSLRFEGVTGRTASPSGGQKTRPSAPSPMTPDVVAPDPSRPAPEMGTWRIG
jgi:hypothetical protein